MYVFFGGCTTLVNYASYYVFTRFLGWDVMLSNAAAWILSVLFAYVTNKIWVFESRSFKAGVLARELASFVGCRLFSGAVDMGVVWLGVTVLSINDMIVKIISNIIVIILNYFASKLWIFRKKEGVKNEQ